LLGNCFPIELWRAVEGNPCIPVALNLNIASKLIEATVWPLTLHMALVGSRREEEGGGMVRRRDGREEGW